MDQIDVDIRIISAMNINYQMAIDSKQLRSDLFYRLAAAQLHLPPIRERFNDISTLISEFLDEGFEISPVAMNMLLAYTWPGNVRELKNAITYGMSICKNKYITVKELPEYILYGSKKAETIKQNRSGKTLAQMTADFETEISATEMGLFHP